MAKPPRFIPTRKARPTRVRRYEIVIEEYADENGDLDREVFILKDPAKPGQFFRTENFDQFSCETLQVLERPETFDEVALFPTPQRRKTETELLVEEYLAKGGKVKKIATGQSQKDRPKLTLADIGLDFEEK